MAGSLNGALPTASVRRAVVLGYYDGATDGVIQFDGGAAYRFDLTDEADLLPEAIGRRFTLRALPPDAVDRLADGLAVLGLPTWPVWCPRWKFPTDDARQAAEAAVEELLATAGPATAEMTTADPHGFSRVRVGSALATAG